MSTLEDDLKYIAEYALPYDVLKGRTVLVTGATGLIGSTLVRALLTIDDIKVIAFVRNLRKAENIFEKNSNLKIISGDIIMPLHIEEAIDFIFHCASITASKMMIENPVETLLTALDGTKNILNLAVEKKSKSVVYISSMEMYGSFDHINHDVIESDLGYIDPLKVRSNYPESKRVCENMCIAYMNEYNVPVKIARLAQTFGAGVSLSENRVFAQFAKSAVNNKDIVLHTDGLSEGNYCYTRDCITGLLTILLKGTNGEAYNVSNPLSHCTIRSMAEMVVKDIARNKIKVIFDIPNTNVFGYAASTKLKLNSNKLQALGWKPTIDLKESYKRMISYWSETTFQDI